MITFSIIKKSQLEGAHRLDAEYYQPEYLNVERKLASINTTTIDEISESVVSFGAYSLCNYIEWKETGIPYLNVENIKDGYIDFEGVKFINDEVNEILEKSKVKEGQVIITMAGTIGNAAVAYRVPSKINSNQATAKITLKKGFSPYFLAAFLGSYYGRRQTEREIVSSVQPNIFLWQIKNFRVPIVSEDKQKEIEKIFKQKLDKLEESKSLYSQVENLLLEELGLKDFKPEEELSYVVNLSNVKTANRTDAEYFKPKYNKLIDYLKDKFELKKIRELVTIQKGIEPGSKKYQKNGKTFIRVSNLSKFGINDNNQKYISYDFYQELRENYNPKVGEILLTKDASPGIAYVVKEPIEGIISSGILRLKIKENLQPEYLALLINLLVGQYQMERDTGGSVIIHWRPEQIKNMYIPILSKSTQIKISNFVRQSYQARQEAKQLLNEAKEKVEKMILNFKNG